MPSRQTLAILVLVLSIAMFIVSSDTAQKMDSRPRFNYLNPTYILNVMVAVGSAVTAAICLIDLHRIAEYKVKTRNLFQYYDSLRFEMADEVLENQKKH